MAGSLETPQETVSPVPEKSEVVEIPIPENVQPRARRVKQPKREQDTEVAGSRYPLRRSKRTRTTKDGGADEEEESKAEAEVEAVLTVGPMPEWEDTPYKPPPTSPPREAGPSRSRARDPDALPRKKKRRVVESENIPVKGKDRARG
jgi:hypothetical protein